MTLGPPSDIRPEDRPWRIAGILLLVLSTVLVIAVIYVLVTAFIT